PRWRTMGRPDSLNGYIGSKGVSPRNSSVCSTTVIAQSFPSGCELPSGQPHSIGGEADAMRTLVAGMSPPTLYGAVPCPATYQLELRASIPSQATRRRQIRYSNRIATAGDRARRPPSSNPTDRCRGRPVQHPQDDLLGTHILPGTVQVKLASLYWYQT